MTDPRLATTADLSTAAAPLTSDHKSETQRAYREARTAITLLQQRWPAAFPEGPQQVRPLITGLVLIIAAELGWSHPYARAVLLTWKLRPAYCRAVLAHPVRFDLEATQPTSRSTRRPANRQRLASPPGPASAISCRRDGASGLQRRQWITARSSSKWSRYRNTKARQCNSRPQHRLPQAAAAPATGESASSVQAATTKAKKSRLPHPPPSLSARCSQPQPGAPATRCAGRATPARSCARRSTIRPRC